MNLPAVTWDSLDWPTLDRLRQSFLSGQSSPSNYWQSITDLANYDFTYAQRIGWKWDAVICELKHRGWSPPKSTLVDWGCGSGIASRCVLDGFGVDQFASLELFDRSSLAMQFAAARAHARFPGLSTIAEGNSSSGDRAASPATSQPRTLLISHVLNELDETGGRTLRAAIDDAAAVLWVEPGASADSRSLIAMREALLEPFQVIAPCTHQARCGLLTTGNERHWCHHFAQPPPNIMSDSGWVQFARRAGIDLRSTPYSFLVLERRGLRPVPGRSTEGWSCLIGTTRLYKAFAKVQSCQADGVHDLELQKRDCPKIFKAFAAGRGDLLYRWTIDGRWIRAAEAWEKKGL